MRCIVGTIRVVGATFLSVLVTLLLAVIVDHCSVRDASESDVDLDAEVRDNAMEASDRQQ